MSTVHPKESEYEMHDSFELAKNISWVIKSLYGFAIVVVLATAWAVSLAGDVESNTKELEKKATAEQLTTMTEILRRVESKIDKQDERQRDIKEGLDRMDERLEAVEEHVERDEGR